MGGIPSISASSSASSRSGDVSTNNTFGNTSFGNQGAGASSGFSTSTIAILGGIAAVVLYFVFGKKA